MLALFYVALVSLLLLFVWFRQESESLQVLTNPQDIRSLCRDARDASILLLFYKANTVIYFNSILRFFGLQYMIVE